MGGVEFRDVAIYVVCITTTGVLKVGIGVGVRSLGGGGAVTRLERL